jgi:hypothetical protein
MKRYLLQQNWMRLSRDVGSPLRLLPDYDKIKVYFPVDLPM